MKRALLLAAPLCLAACVQAEPPHPVPLQTPVLATAWAGSNATASIGFGGRAMLNGISIRPLAIAEDSRCPINARCVWAGRLTLNVELGQPGTPPRQVDMTLGQPIPVAGGTLTLVSAEPGRLAGAPVPTPARQFAFELRR